MDYICIVQNVIVIDRDTEIRAKVSSAIKRGGINVLWADDGASGMAAIRRDTVHLICLGARLMDMGAEDFFRETRRMNITCPVIVISPPGDDAAAAGAAGWAFEVIGADEGAEAITAAVNRALLVSSLIEEVAGLRRLMLSRFDYPLTAGSSPAMRKAYRTLARVSCDDTSVLITGEEGTGKLTIAKSIHERSARASRNFVQINCAAVPDSMLVADIFGREVGSHGGNIAARPGKLDLAALGTLYLEDVDMLHPSVQAKMLATITSGEYERIGGMTPVPLNVRVIAGTLADMKALAKKGKFSKPLLDIISQAAIALPPLRERKEDIPQLIVRMVAEHLGSQKDMRVRIEEDAIEALSAHDWPGNLQELDEVAGRVAALATSGVIKFSMLPQTVRGKTPAKPKTQNPEDALDFLSLTLPTGGIDMPALLDEIEDTLITQALDRSKGVKTSAAELLGLNRTTLLEKLRKRGMIVPRSSGRKEK